MVLAIAWVMALTAVAAAVPPVVSTGPAALLRAAAGPRVTDVRPQSVVVGDFRADASYAFAMKDGRRVSGHVIAREYPLAEAPALWVLDAQVDGMARAFLPTARAFVELSTRADGGTERLRERLRLRRPVMEPGAGLPRLVSAPVAGGAGYRLRSAFQPRYRALTQAASATYLWISEGRVHVVTHWISKARAATEAHALLRVMERLLPKDWPGQSGTQTTRLAWR